MNLRALWFVVAVAVVPAVAWAQGLLLEDFRIAGVNGLRIDSLDFAVTVTGPPAAADGDAATDGDGTTDGEFRVQVYGTAQDGVVLSVVRNVLRVRVEPLRGWSGRRDDVRQIVVTMPHDRWLSITGTAGTIHLANLRVDRAAVSTGAGDIALQVVDGRLAAVTGAGEIVSQDTNGAIDLETSAGRSIQVTGHDGPLTVRSPTATVALTNTSGVFDVEVVRGDIVADGLTITGHSFFRSIAGDISIANLRSDAPLQATTYTVHGRVSVPDAWEQRTFGLNTRAVRFPPAIRVHVEVVRGVITVQ